MSLLEFVKRFVRPNSLIKLWKKTEGESGYTLIFEDDPKDSSCMEWHIIKGIVWQSKYNKAEVIGIKDIVCEDYHRYAINIVIDVK